MHPTQRKLMKRIILFLSLLFCIACPAIAGQDIDLVANVKNSTCKSGISNQGNIDLGVVGVGYFSGNVTPESSSGASNVGVVIFSTQDSANTFNVLNASGGSRSVYPVMSDDMNGSSWKFSTRMQKIDPALSVTSGQLMSHVLVDIYYE